MLIIFTLFSFKSFILLMRNMTKVSVLGVCIKNTLGKAHESIPSEVYSIDDLRKTIVLTVK